MQKRKVGTEDIIHASLQIYLLSLGMASYKPFLGHRGNGYLVRDLHRKFKLGFYSFRFDNYWSPVLMIKSGFINLKRSRHDKYRAAFLDRNYTACGKTFSITNTLSISRIKI